MINEEFLNTIAAGLNGESMVVPAYLTHGTDSITINPTMTSLDGEQAGGRHLVSSLRENNLVTFTAIRSGADVISTGGDTLYSSALFDSASGGTLLAAVSLPGLLHTTSFDIETSWDISIERD